MEFEYSIADNLIIYIVVFSVFIQFIYFHLPQFRLGDKRIKWVKTTQSSTIHSPEHYEFC